MKKSFWAFIIGFIIIQVVMFLFEKKAERVAVAQREASVKRIVDYAAAKQAAVNKATQTNNRKVIEVENVA